MAVIAVVITARTCDVPIRRGERYVLTVITPGDPALPANVRKAAQVLCCKRAREARQAIAAAAGLRTARPGAREGEA